MSELKSRKFKERRFKAAKVKIKNLVFIKTTLADPNKLTEAIFTDLEKQKVTKTRYVLLIYRNVCLLLMFYLACSMLCMIWVFL